MRLSRMMFFTLGLVGSSAWATSYDDLVQNALANSPQLTAQDSQIQQAELARQTSDFARYPVINGGVEESSDGTVTQLRLTQVLFDGGSRSAQIDQSQADLERQQLTRRAGELDLVLDLVQQLSEYQRLAQVEQATQQHLSSHNELLAIIERRADAGLGPKSDIIQAQAWTQLVQADLQSIQLQRAQQASQLAQGLSIELPARVALPAGNLELGRSEQLIALARDFSPQRKALLAQQAGLVQAVELAKGKRFPQLELNYQRNFGDLGAADRERVFLSLSTDFSPGFSEVFEVDQAELELRGFLNTLEQLDRDLDLQIQLDQSQRLSNALLAQRNLAVAEQLRQVVDAAKRQANAGRKSWLEVFTSLRELYRANVQAITADSEQTHARLSLEYLTGQRSW